MTPGTITQIADDMFLSASQIRPVLVKATNQADRREMEGLPSWRAEERLAARALLRSILEMVADARAAASPIGAKRRGRPFLILHPSIGISLSHTNGWVAAAVSTTIYDVGVDVQVPMPASAGILKKCCTATAREFLGTLGAERRNEEFARIWSAQEACVKASGDGLAGRPWTMPVEVGQFSGRWRGITWRTPTGLQPVALSYAHRPRSWL